jgi:cellulose biosynthesis protein BcsQ
MIHISDIANKIKTFLDSKGEEKFKIYVRINFNIDVYVLTPNVAIARDYQREFLDSLYVSDIEDVFVDDFYKKHSNSLKVNFNIVNAEDAEGDPFYANMFNTRDSVIDWGPRYRFDSLLRTNIVELEKGKTKKKAPVVTFYSYKGGMGRTTTMVAYAMSLAANSDITKRKRVVIIDCDLEAPGYLNFFDLSEHNGLRSGKKNGFVEFVCDAQLTLNPNDIDINDYIINVGLDNKNNFAYNNLDNIWLVPAGNLNEGYADIENDSDRNDYLEGLAKINLSSVPSVVKYFNLLFDKINETIHPDIILIDSRTGFNDIFGTAALYLSSYVVGFFGFSRQTQPGLINLLKDYYKPENHFKLQLVFSILPENATEEWVNHHKQQVLEYLNFISSEDKDYPSFLYLHRNPLLEQIGTGDNQSDSAFVNLVKERKFEDYNTLFDQISSHFFREKESEFFNSKTPALTLRNVVLKQLKNSLANVSNFAEDTQIKEEQFFYRECMKELFDPKKFLIQGYKGTGKTYLYKALADKEIAANIQKWAGMEDTNMLESIFVNILPTNETSLVFDNIRYGGIEEPEYYFNAFWQIYTWNVLLLNDEFEEIKEISELRDYVKPLEGTGFAKEALIRIDELINMGVKSSVAIEKDILRINDYLALKGKRLFVLYDRLDTCVNPLRWSKAVSPLINYWRNNCESFSNIIPKIFVRTDLFRQIEGTNTARLENNIIHIEWSIGEVFGYFFKLIFSDIKASKAYWAIAEKVGINAQYIKLTKKSFEKFPKNQFKSIERAGMIPIIQVFFGKYVNVGAASLGSPWDYFSKELANADHTAISLRPFINTLDNNAVDIALSRTEKYVKNGIISPEIYASKAVREETTEKYFADLTQDAFSKDLLRFKEVIRTSEGERFRFKSLSESQFEELIATTYSKIEDSEVVKSSVDLKRLIFANGIMAEKTTTKGRYYRFAPIYWYSWGLVNSALENEEKKKSKQSNNELVIETLPKKEKISLIEGKEYSGIIMTPKFGVEPTQIECKESPYPLQMRGAYDTSLYPDAEVWFVAGKEPNQKDKAKPYWFAYNIRMKEE